MQKQQTMIQKNLKNILGRIAEASKKCQVQKNVRLVAVSKTKTVQQIKQAYDAGIRNFGQNYVDQIQEKQPKLPNDIKWHFIGHLQSNKIKKVLVSNLQFLETVDRESLAQKLQKHLEKNQKDRKLKIFIQVKTSQQQSKNGVQQAQLEQLYQYIKQKCPNLIFKGLMTIGKEGDLEAFRKMKELKNKLSQKFQINDQQFELSMGMSADFEEAIQLGSTNVRVGSLIFGPRNYPKKQEQHIKKAQQKPKSKSKQKPKSNQKQ